MENIERKSKSISRYARNLKRRELIRECKMRRESNARLEHIASVYRAANINWTIKGRTRFLLSAVTIPQLALPKLSFAQAAFVGVTTLLFAIPAVSLASPDMANSMASFLYGVIPKYTYIEQINANAMCAQNIAVKDDSTGQLLTTLPNQSRSCRDRTYQSFEVLPADATKQAEALIAVEGRFTGPGKILTTDLLGLMRGVYYGVQLEKVGGTGPDQSAIEAVSSHKGRIDIASKLAMTILHAPKYAVEFTPSVADRKKFAVENLQCARGMKGTGGGFVAIAGGYCGVLVGKASMEDLSLAEGCLVASSHLKPISIPGPTANPDQMATYYNEFAELKTRSINKCLAKRLAGSDLKAAIYETNQISLPDHRAIRDIALHRNSAFEGAESFLRETLGPNGATSLKIPAQKALFKSVQRDLGQSISYKMNEELCLPGSPNCDDKELLDAGFLLAEVQSNGTIKTVAAYQSRAGLLTYDGDMQRSFASTVKALLVPLLLEHGIQRVCRAAGASLHDADGYEGGSCDDPKNWLTLESALSRSSNLGFLYGLKQVPENKIRDYLRALNYTIGPDLAGDTFLRSIIIGDLVTVSPLNLTNAFAAIAMETETPSAITKKLTGFVSLSALADAKKMLSQPILANNGTARSAKPILKEAGCLEGAAAKTGTADGLVANKARDRILLAGFECNGNKFVFFSLIGSPDPARELGDQIKSYHHIKLSIRAALSAAKAMEN